MFCKYKFIKFVNLHLNCQLTLVTVNLHLQTVNLHLQTVNLHLPGHDVSKRCLKPSIMEDHQSMDEVALNRMLFLLTASVQVLSFA